MVTNDEIRQRLHEQREGTNIKEYLVCNNCEGAYELLPGEKPEDFSDECECGGKLTYSKDSSINDNKPTKTNKMVKNGLIIFIVVLGLVIFIGPMAYIGFVGMVVSHDEESGSAYDQLAVLKSDYNSLNDQFTNVQTSVDSSNNQNAKTAFINAKLELVKANSDINDVESALSSGKSKDEITQRVNTAQTQLNKAQSELSNVKAMI
ncbi:hypothetical protein Metbo_1994 [Methanobacterium lacus]|uniref:Uncharacterized protein n=1 Tax=Methanobacterium lacus (strain AL-21) TaxID=877455 RepID=F0TBE5_METLA|nr:hypothetical protein [Methanobacterium lacus]ADZ10214.1 hypothetical protein Metbo_1994 [Methanobacterium lacus]